MRAAESFLTRFGLTLVGGLTSLSFLILHIHNRVIKYHLLHDLVDDITRGHYLDNQDSNGNEVGSTNPLPPREIYEPIQLCTDR